MERHPVDALLELLDKTLQRIEQATDIPKLYLIDVVDDAGTEDEWRHAVIWCPRCDQRVEDLVETEYHIADNEAEIEHYDEYVEITSNQDDVERTTLVWMHRGHAVDVSAFSDSIVWQN